MYALCMWTDNLLTSDSFFSVCYIYKHIIVHNINMLYYYFFLHKCFTSILSIYIHYTITLHYIHYIMIIIHGNSSIYLSLYTMFYRDVYSNRYIPIKIEIKIKDPLIIWLSYKLSHIISKYITSPTAKLHHIIGVNFFSIRCYCIE